MQKKVNKIKTKEDKNKKKCLKNYLLRNHMLYEAESSLKLFIILAFINFVICLVIHQRTWLLSNLNVAID